MTVPISGAPIPGSDVEVDLHRCIVFPNRLRELRRMRGFPKLLPFAAKVPDIPYIRLSKIERGEVVARVDELRRIAAALSVEAEDLLLDIDAPQFDIALWSEPFQDKHPVDLAEERFAVLLGAALRARRTGDPALTIAVLDRSYGLPPVNLSRVENAQKLFARWNPAIQASLFKLFDVQDEAGLRSEILRLYRTGALAPFTGQIANPQARHERTRARIAELRTALGAPAAATPAVAARPAPDMRVAGPAPAPARFLSVMGTPLPGGLIAPTPIPERIEAPAMAGPDAFGLKVCRATLGGGLPAHATVVVDPGRFPVAGSLAALREGGGWRILSVSQERDGRLTGYSVHPEFEVSLDERDPREVAAVIAASFV